MAAGFRRGRSRLELNVDHGFEVARLRQSAAADIGVSLSVPWMLGVAGCWTLWQGAMELDGCGGAGYGRMLGRGAGVSEPQSAQTPLAELRAGVALSRRLTGPVWGRLEGTVLAPLSRPSFLIEGEGTFFTVHPVGGRLHLGLELRFL